MPCPDKRSGVLHLDCFLAGTEASALRCRGARSVDSSWDTPIAAAVGVPFPPLPAELLPSVVRPRLTGHTLGGSWPPLLLQRLVGCSHSCGMERSTATVNYYCRSKQAVNAGDIRCDEVRDMFYLETRLRNVDGGSCRGAEPKQAAEESRRVRGKVWTSCSQGSRLI